MSIQCEADLVPGKCRLGMNIQNINTITALTSRVEYAKENNALQCLWALQLMIVWGMSPLHSQTAFMCRILDINID